MKPEHIEAGTKQMESVEFVAGKYQEAGLEKQDAFDLALWHHLALEAAFFGQDLPVELREKIAVLEDKLRACGSQGPAGASE